MRLDKEILNVALELLFPPKCLHCHEKSSVENPLLCADCLAYFQPIDPIEVCEKCGEPLRSRHCKERSLYNGKFILFEWMGPPKKVIQLFLKPRLYLAKPLAGYLALQLDKLNWPKFDLITYRPDSKVLKPLASELSTLLGIPYASLLRKSFLDNTYRLKRWRPIYDQKVLVLDEFLLKNTSEQLCRALQEGAPGATYLFALAAP